MKNLQSRLLFCAIVIALILVSLSGSTAFADPPPGGDIEPDVALDQSFYRLSGSSHLRLPAELRNVPMMEAPAQRMEPAPADPTAMAIYEVATGQVMVIPSGDPSQAPITVNGNTVGSNVGLLPTAPAIDTPIGADDRVRVTATYNFPWRTIAKLYVTFPDGSTGGCSGAIIDDYHILTAGHCVHDGFNGGDWASTIRAVPGLDDDYMPYNEAWVTYMRSYTGWTESGMHEHDWAVVTLDRNIGPWVGWMGRTTADPSDPLYTGILNNAGYPGLTPSDDPCPTYLSCMYFDSDNGHSADEHNHWYWIDTAGGQSGSPVWRYLSATEERHITTVHAYGVDDTGVNHGTRLNQDKYDRIFTWIGADTPPTDYADLIDDGEIYAGFSPTEVTPGTTTFDVWNDVRNIGTGNSGTFSVSYYASTNSTISTGDFLIGTGTVSSVSSFAWENSGWSGTFPASIPNGTYYVGWIIDANDDVAEYDESNNIAYLSATQLVVSPQASSPPNDDIDNATDVNASPFTDVLDTRGATTAGDDPNFPCGSGDTGSESVWYELTVAQDTTVYAHTFGSSYDTMLALWSGTRGSLSNVACNDDASGLQSEISAPVSAGTYYLEVADYFADGAVSAESKPGTGAEGDPNVINGGDLSLYVELTPILFPDIDVSPTSFEVTLAPDVTHGETMTIGNVGDVDLNVTLGIQDTTAASAAWSPLAFPSDPVEPDVYAQIAAAPDGIGVFLVYLNQQADLSGALAIADRNVRGQVVYDSLWQTAQTSQGGLKKYLDYAIANRLVTEYRPYYIVNAIEVHGTAEVVDLLAARPDVSYIEAYDEYAIPEPSPGEGTGVTALEWGVSQIGADTVWSSFSTQGEGIVVANIDTGVLHTHAALVDQYRGTTTGSHDYNWFDPTGTYPTAPGDNDGHGTHTMGTMAGDDGGSNQIGVAPGAMWIAAKGCEDNGCSGGALLASAEWVLAPYPIGGSPANADPSKRPHVVNNSWGGPGGDLWYQASVNNWRAAGIFPAFSAGNSGPGTGTHGSPGDYAESFSSGATDINDVIAGFSSRGPSSVTAETKPDISAPGVNVRSSYNNGDYAYLNGTSMASPHTAGCAALIFAAAPGVSITQAEDAMMSSAVDLGASGPDYDYGHGRLDCYQAVILVGPGVDWLSVNPTSAIIGPSGSTTIDVEFDTTGLAPGDYSADIVILSNDPDESPIRVPVLLHVDGGVIQPGDCNGDGVVDAGDIAACILEVFDGDGDQAGDARGGTFSGDPVGCDANDDGLINAGDIACKILIIFNGPGACGGPTTYRLSNPMDEPSSLAIPENIAVDPAENVSIPILFGANGNEVAAATFSVALDSEWLPVDPADSDGDGTADMVLFTLPDGFTASATVHEDDNTIDVFIADLSVPLSGLPDGELMTMTVTVGTPPDGRSRTAKVDFADAPAPSLGSTTGQSVNTYAEGGSVLITPVVTTTEESLQQLFLPVVTK